MNNDLVKSASRIFFGSSVAGVGISLGRDLYSFFKKNVLMIIFIAVFVGGLIFPFIAAIKTFSWYPIGKVKWLLFKFLPWTSVAILGTVIQLFYFVLLVEVLGNYSITVVEVSGKNIGVIIYISFGLYLFGLIFVLFKRKKQREAHVVERHNIDFLKINGIKEIHGGKEFTHIDNNGNMLRLVTIGIDVITFLIVGKRGKRSYILVGKDGKFMQYTGICSI